MPNHRSQCIVASCNDGFPDLCYYKLPKDRERCRKWLENLGRLDLLDVPGFSDKHYRVCSAHFDSFKLARQLYHDAVPIHGFTFARNRVDKIKVNTHKINLSKDVSAEIKTLSREENADTPITTSINANVVIDIIIRKLVLWHKNKLEEFQKNQHHTGYKELAINLYYASPHIYRNLGSVISLPSKKRLSTLKLNIPPTFGLSDYRMLKSLALKIESLPDIAKYCTLCIDDIQLKKSLYYDTKTDEVTGFHNINGAVASEMANFAIVLMLQGIYHKWERPLAYAFISSTEYYEEIDFWLDEVICSLSNIGIQIKAITARENSLIDNFFKDAKNVTMDSPFVDYNNSKIYYILDVPHLMKSIHKNLLKCDFQLPNGQTVYYNFIKRLYCHQKGKKLKLIPKITDFHIKPCEVESEKAQSKYAVQILSRTVSTALHTYIDLGILTEEARTTAVFIETINNLFDVLNTSKSQTAFKMTEDQQAVLQEAEKIFANVKVVNRETREDHTADIKTISNFQLTIQSMKMLYEDLKKEGFTCLLTRRLNKDSLENVLEAIKLLTGSRSDPTPIQFRRAFSKCVVDNMLKESPCVNYKLDKIDILQEIEKLIPKLETTILTPEQSAVSLHFLKSTDYRLDLPEEHSLAYVSGYLLYKCWKTHMCNMMTAIWDACPNFNTLQKYKNFKTYNKNSLFYGQLRMPPIKFIQYVDNLETAFAQNFEEQIPDKVGGRLLKIFENIPDQAPCKCFPTRYLYVLFIRFRIYATLKFNNRNCL